MKPNIRQLINIFTAGILCIPAAVSADDDTPLQQARKAYLAYDFDTAQSIIDDIEAANRKNKRKNPLPEGLDELKAEIDKAVAMLDRVESIEIIDSICVPQAAFFSHYRLSAPAGSLTSPAGLPQGFAAAPETSVFTTEDGTMTLWSAPGPDGRLVILESDRLTDGTYTKPEPIKGDLSDGDMNFPFLASDGVTLYYAAKGGDDSLGGYDIYMTRREDDAYLLPQNIGMPYNSPFNDYLLAIDEERGLGWWATERNAPMGMVTIYTFIPRDMRQNYAADNPDIAGLAFVRSIKATQTPGKDYSAYLAGADDSSRTRIPDFELSVPGCGIYHTMADFASMQARELMEDYLYLRHQYARLEADLAANRMAYGKGKRGLAPDITDAEEQLARWDAELLRLSNEVIRAEQSAR